MPPVPSRSLGFTLIELALVITIIGLIVGGTLVGKDLIRAAQLRAQVRQIQHYGVAVNTFRDKYRALPGDMQANLAASSGFFPRSGADGHGDGNYIISGCSSIDPVGCENLMFWSDLSNARMIADTISTSVDGPMVTTTFAESMAYMPAPKMISNSTIGVTANSNSEHWFYIIRIGWMNGGSLMTYRVDAIDAFNLDAKLDNANPMTGVVMIKELGAGADWFFGAPTDAVNRCVYNGMYNLLPGTMPCMPVFRIPGL
jgi:prepilin-type N-terminal cleavage/methylation domain-containing protein